jgi:serine/threonine protein kinase
VHPHVLRCFGRTKCFDDSWILLTEHAAYGDLLSFYKELGVGVEKDKNNNLKGIGLSMGKRLQMTNQLMQALRHMHKNGVIHRDLKPQNILVSAQKNILLGDFGATLDEEREGA